MGALRCNALFQYYGRNSLFTLQCIVSLCFAFQCYGWNSLCLCGHLTNVALYCIVLYRLLHCIGLDCVAPWITALHSSPVGRPKQIGLGVHCTLQWHCSCMCQAILFHTWAEVTVVTQCPMNCVWIPIQCNALQWNIWQCKFDPNIITALDNTVIHFHSVDCRGMHFYVLMQLQKNAVF